MNRDAAPEWPTHDSAVFGGVENRHSARSLVIATSAARGTAVPRQQRRGGERVDLREMKERANALYASGKWARSRKLYEAVIDAWPRDPYLHLRHAQLSERLGDRRSASRSFRRAAEIWSETGLQARAVAAFRLALRFNPQDADAREGLSKVRVEAPAAPEGLQPTPTASPPVVADASGPSIELIEDDRDAVVDDTRIPPPPPGEADLFPDEEAFEDLYH